MARRNYKPTGNPVGRPRITIDEFPKDWKTELIKMGEQGMLDVDIRVYLNISTETFYRLLERESEFLEIVSRMRELSHIWWINISRNSFANGTSKQVNSQLYSLIMRNRFKDEWNAENKVDITTGGEKIDSNKKIEIEIIRKAIDGNESK